MRSASRPWDLACLSTPLFASVAGAARSFGQRPDWPEAAQLTALARDKGLANARGRPLRFTPQTSRCGQREYEAEIWADGRVPTRPHNWHDLLNALIWLSFPRTKAALNALQHSGLAPGAGGRRGPLSDAATLFDESGLVLVASGQELADDMAQRLRAHRWHEAFVVRRREWEAIRCYVFGHGLLEQALAPFPAMTAKCLVLTAPALPPRDAPLPDWLDGRMAGLWARGAIARPGDLFPVPLLGIPGLWPGNADPGFYGRRDVFRPLLAPGCPARMTDDNDPQPAA
jgi:Protein of unknown function (DUF3025)